MALIEVRERGLREARAALRRVDTGLGKQVTKSIKKGADLVTTASRSRQASEFEHTRPGALRSTARGTTAFIQSRGSRGKRGDFGALIVKRAILPSMFEEQGAVYQMIIAEIERLIREAGL